MNRDELRECQEALNALWAYYEEGVEGSMWFRHNLDILQKILMHSASEQKCDESEEKKYD